MHLGQGGRFGRISRRIFGRFCGPRQVVLRLIQAGPILDGKQECDVKSSLTSISHEFFFILSLLQLKERMPIADTESHSGNSC
jgi:hypothetical protein